MTEEDGDGKQRRREGRGVVMMRGDAREEELRSEGTRVKSRVCDVFSVKKSRCCVITLSRLDCGGVRFSLLHLIYSTAVSINGTVPETIHRTRESMCSDPTHISCYEHTVVVTSFNPQDYSKRNPHSHATNSHRPTIRPQLPTPTMQFDASHRTRYSHTIPKHASITSKISRRLLHFAITLYQRIHCELIECPACKRTDCQCTARPHLGDELQPQLQQLLPFHHSAPPHLRLCALAPAA